MKEKLAKVWSKICAVWHKFQQWADQTYEKLPLDKINNKLKGKVDVKSKKFKQIGGYLLLGTFCVVFICLIVSLCTESEEARRKRLNAERQAKYEAEFRKLQEESVKNAAEMYRQQFEYVKIQQQKQMEEAQAQLELSRKKREAEQARLAEEERQRAEKARLEEERRKAEEARLAEERRIAEERRKAEIARREEERRKAEEARLAEERRIAEEHRKAEEARLAEERRIAEERRKAEEARLAEQRRIMEERKAAEERKAREKAALRKQFATKDKISGTDRRKLATYNGNPEKLAADFFTLGFNLQRHIITKNLIDPQMLWKTQNNDLTLLEKNWQSLLKKIEKIAEEINKGRDHGVPFLEFARAIAARNSHQSKFPRYETLYQLTLLVDAAKQGVKFSAMPRIKISEIHAAVLSNDIRKVEEILNAKPYLINAKDSFDRTPVFYAWTVEMTKTLVAHNAEIAVTDVLDVPLFYYAVAYANKDLLKLYFSPSFTDPDLKEKFQFADKYITAGIKQQKQHARDKKDLIDRGEWMAAGMAGENNFIQEFYTFAIAMSRDVEIIDFLLNRYSPLYADGCVSSMYQIAAIANAWDIVVSMLDRGYKFNRFVDVVDSGNKEMVKYLISLGYKDSEAYSVALKNNDSDMINVLLEAKIKPTADALDLAIKNGNLKVVQQLLAVNAPSTDKSFLLAVENGHLEIVKVLVEVGLKFDKETVKKAREKNYNEIADYLEKLLL